MFYKSHLFKNIFTILAGRDQREPPDYINTGSGQPHSLERSNGRLVSFIS